MKFNINQPDWLFNEEAMNHRAIALYEQMDVDFAAFISEVNRCREVAKLSEARFAEGVLTRLAADGLRMQGLYGPSIETAVQAKYLLSAFPTSEQYLLAIRTLASGYVVSDNVGIGLKTYGEGFEAAKSLGQFREAIVFAFHLCHWNRESGHFEQALHYLKVVSEDLIGHCPNDGGFQILIYANYGEVYMEMGRWKEAEEILIEGLRICDPSVVMYYMYLHGAMACVKATNGLDQEARDLLKTAQDDSLKFADRRLTAWFSHRLGKTYVASNRPDRAIEYLQDSIGICERNGYEWLLVDNYEVLMNAYEGLGDIQAALMTSKMAYGILQGARKEKLSREAKALELLNYTWTTRESELQHEISEALVRGKEAAERASQFKSMFLTKMSHELRTPLNGVLGVTRMLLDHKLDGEERELAKTIYTSGQHILNLVNGVLDLSKLEAGTLALSIQPFSLKGLVEEVLALYSPLCRAKNIGIEGEVSPLLGDEVEGDRTRIAQVITNLVGNSIKFTAFGCLDLKIDRCSDAHEPQRVRFVVKDTGIGIAVEDQAFIFEMFGQGPRGKFTGGAGIGLSISRELVSLMGGQIGVKSGVGMGSEFWFEIPLPSTAEEPPAVLSASNASSEAQSSPPLTGVRILAAEDDEINWMVLESILEHLGATSVRAANGKEAIDQFMSRKFDLIILDCHMDVMDGFEASQAIRCSEATCRVPIIALSADVLEANQQRCFASGMDGFVGKPVQVHELISKIAELAPDLIASGSNR